MCLSWLCGAKHPPSRQQQSHGRSSESRTCSISRRAHCSELSRSRAGAGVLRHAYHFARILRVQATVKKRLCQWEKHHVSPGFRKNPKIRICPGVAEITRQVEKSTLSSYEMSMPGSLRTKSTRTSYEMSISVLCRLSKFFSFGPLSLDQRHWARLRLP